MSALGGIYSRVARARRQWYRQPHRQKHLQNPVISVGNLVAGGSGKTPMVAELARLLEAQGERPAILSRGYRRRSQAPLIVVSDGAGYIVEVAESGDEPQMLARALPRVPILVSADRYDAGRHAETVLGATVHLLDDGFQHVKLARDVDLLMVSADDLEEKMLPMGRLREGLDAAALADALLVTASGAAVDQVRSRLGVSQAFEVVPALSSVRLVHPFAETPPSSDSRRVVAVAAIARPERFFDALIRCGFDVARTLTYPDHYWFDERDVGRIDDAARAAGASVIITTEKDAVRLAPLLSKGSAVAGSVWAYLPYAVRVEPAESFNDWLVARLVAARHARAEGRA